MELTPRNDLLHSFIQISIDYFDMLQPQNVFLPELLKGMGGIVDSYGEEILKRGRVLKIGSLEGQVESGCHPEEFLVHHDCTDFGL